MKKFKVVQIVLFVVICLFMGSFLITPTDSQSSFNYVTKTTLKSEDMEQYSQQNNQNIKRFLSVDPTAYKNISYYKNVDDMKASEIVLVQFRSDDQAAAFEEAMNQRVANQLNIYDAYLPKEADLCREAVVYTQANYGIYVTNKKADAIVDRFKTSLKGESK